MIRPERRRDGFHAAKAASAVALFATILVIPSFCLVELVQFAVRHALPLWVKLILAVAWFWLAYMFLKVLFDHMLRIRARRGLIRPPNMLEEALGALDRIASGDYNVRLPEEATHHRAFGELNDRINRLARDLSSVEQMRQEFISNVSHEIQSPLTSISGFASLLKKEDLPREKRLHYIEVIESESRRLSGLSDNLLRLSALDSEQTVVAHSHFRLDKQLEDTLLMLEPQWSEKDLELDISLEPLTVCGDMDLLSQVWINLLHNAIKFTPAGGMISAHLAQGDKGVTCTISDTGPGISEESLVRIFERFYKADKSRDRSLGGNGLGLSLVQKIVELHGGRVTAESRPDEGASFTVLLPGKE